MVDQLQALRKDLAAVESGRDELERKLSLLEEERARMQQSLGDAMSQHETFVRESADRMESLRAEMQGREEALQGEMAKLRLLQEDAVSSLDAEIRRLSSNLAQAEAQLEEKEQLLREVRASMQERLSAAGREEDALNLQIGELKRLNEELNERSREKSEGIFARDKQIAELAGQLASLKNSLSNSEQQRSR